MLSSKRSRPALACRRFRRAAGLAKAFRGYFGVTLGSPPGEPGGGMTGMPLPTGGAC